MTPLPKNEDATVPAHCDNCDPSFLDCWNNPALCRKTTAPAVSQTPMDAVNLETWRCSALLYHEELRRLARGEKVETQLALPVEKKIRTLERELEEAKLIAESHCDTARTQHVELATLRTALAAAETANCTDPETRGAGMSLLPPRMSDFPSKANRCKAR